MILVMDHVMFAKLDTMSYLILSISEIVANCIITDVMNAMTLKDTKVIREDSCCIEKVL